MDRDQLLHEIEQYRTSSSSTSLDRRTRDGLKSKLQVRIPLSADKLQRAKELEKDSMGIEYVRLDTDIKNHLLDWQREAEEEGRWREKEDEYMECLRQYRNAQDARAENRATAFDINILRQIQSEERVVQWIKMAREVRIKFGKAKDEHWHAKTKLKKELENLVKSHGSNCVTTGADGNAYKVYTSAPGYVLQPSKKTELEVARELVQMLTVSSNLKIIEFKEIIKVLREYKDCFAPLDEMYELVYKVIEHLETNRDHLTRQTLAEACFAVLNIENQLKHAQAMDIVLKSSPKDMQEHAVFYIRNKTRKDKAGKRTTKYSRDRKGRGGYNRDGYTSPYKGNRDNRDRRYNNRRSGNRWKNDRRDSSGRRGDQNYYSRNKGKFQNRKKFRRDSNDDRNKDTKKDDKRLPRTFKRKDQKNN